MARSGVALMMVLALAAAPAGASNGYLAPVPDRGMVFPVARSDWYSVINFSNDWHDPRMRFVDGRWRQVGVHEGTDIIAEPGTPVLSVTDGVIERVGWTFYSGWRVGIRDATGRYWFYAHLDRFSPGVAQGRAIAAGTVIGAVGNTGYGREPGHSDEFIPHLHLGIQAGDGTWSNPYPLLKELYRAAVDATR